jgi:diguanylate cyclase (GGDEF)-like protein
MILIKNRISILDWAIRGAAIFVGAVGAVEIVGWLFQSATFVHLPPGLASMRFNTGGAFAAAGGALWLMHGSAPETPPFRLGHALAVLAAMLGGAGLAQDLSAFLGINQMIRPDDVVAIGTLAPPRNVPLTEFGFLFAGAALFVLKSRDPRVAMCSQWLALPPLALAALGIVGHAYGFKALSAAMAPEAALALFVLALATLAADSTHGFVRIAAGDTAGGIVSRRLLAILPAALFLLGWAEVRGEEAGLFGPQFGAVAAVLIAITVCIGVVVSTAVVLHQIDLVRKQAMARIRDLNARHEQQIVERTEQLANSLEELNEANKKLEQLSQHDGLTGVANRRYFDHYLENQIAIARRHNRTLSLVMCDVDAFKAYNDHYGHQAGDQILKQIAAAIKASSKRTADIVARYGGEEFAIILPETAIRGAMRVAENAREAVAQLKVPHAYSPAGPHVSISGGVAATVWRGEDTAKQLIAEADRMLYEAKRRGRNRVISASPVAA